MDDHQPVTASPAPAPPIRVFIPDGHELVRGGLKRLLEDTPRISKSSVKADLQLKNRTEVAIHARHPG